MKKNETGPKGGLRSPCLNCPKKNEDKTHYNRQLTEACSRTCERLSMWQTLNSRRPYIGTGIDSMVSDY